MTFQLSVAGISGTFPMLPLEVSYCGSPAFLLTPSETEQLFAELHKRAERSGLGAGRVWQAVEELERGRPVEIQLGASDEAVLLIRPVKARPEAAGAPAVETGIDWDTPPESMDARSILNRFETVLSDAVDTGIVSVAAARWHRLALMDHMAEKQRFEREESSPASSPPVPETD